MNGHRLKKLEDGWSSLTSNELRQPNTHWKSRLVQEGNFFTIRFYEAVFSTTCMSALRISARRRNSWWSYPKTSKSLLLSLRSVVCSPVGNRVAVRSDIASANTTTVN